eukprot:scaffold104058_cov62-Phaeocystis_antarctica.AAC.2
MCPLPCTPLFHARLEGPSNDIRALAASTEREKARRLTERRQPTVRVVPGSVERSVVEASVLFLLSLSLMRRCFGISDMKDPT